MLAVFNTVEQKSEIIIQIFVNYNLEKIYFILVLGNYI